jgi:hypothetical protein
MSRISGSDSPTLPSGRTLRIDTDHLLLEMMQTAINRLLRGNIDVQLTEDCVLLRGAVNSWSLKQSAQESIHKMSASRTIVNDLDVVPY